MLNGVENIISVSWLGMMNFLEKETYRLWFRLSLFNFRASSHPWC